MYLASSNGGPVDYPALCKVIPFVGKKDNFVKRGYPQRSMKRQDIPLVKPYTCIFVNGRHLVYTPGWVNMTLLDNILFSSTLTSQQCKKN